MLITFLGAPCSGKTTTAARLFAELKELGHSVEFIAEYARLHIARRRNAMGGALVLDDKDQFEIARGQYEAEQTFSRDDSAITISDSAAFNGLLYVSPVENLNTVAVKTYAISEIEIVDLAFVCDPFEPPPIADRNRIHSYEQAKAIDDKLRNLLGWYTKLEPKLRYLKGDTRFRTQEALRHVFDLLLK